MQRKLIRYLVYNVTNPGRIMHVMSDKEQAEFVASGHSLSDEMEWLLQRRKRKGRLDR